jgi:hypothetical protein
MKRVLALVLSVALAGGGCATARGSQVVAAEPRSDQRGSDSTLMADYVQRLPAGSRVRAVLADGQTLHGTLMRATDTTLVLQPRTRVPEPPIQLAIEKVASVELEPASSTGKAIAVGIVSGAAGTLAVFLVLALILGGAD